MPRTLRRSRGFSLIEIIITLVVLGIAVMCFNLLA